MDSKSIFSKYKDTVKAIYDEEGFICGTGFFISTRGCFMTCAHVFEDDKKYFILIDGDKKEIEIKKQYENEDVAICFVETNGYKYNPIIYKDPLLELTTGEKAFAIVYSGMNEHSLIETEIRYPNDAEYVVLTTELNDGDSGSPIFDGEGNLIGMHDGTLRERLKRNWSIEIPSSLIWKFYFDFVFPLNVELLKSSSEKDFNGHLGFALEIRQEYETSLYYYWLGVEKKEIWATVRLACHYECGDVVEKNYDKAFLLFKKAGSNTIARYKIAEYYRYGYSVKKDIDEAIKLYEKNIESTIDDGLSKRALAELYSDYGIHYNLESSYKLYQELVHQGVDLKDDLNYLFIKAKYERKNPMNEYIYLHERGFKKASFELALKFYNGTFPILYSDSKRAILLLDDLSSKGYDLANIELFEIYVKKRNYDKALLYFERIKDANLLKIVSPKIYFRIGRHYLYKDIDKAKTFFNLCDGYENQKNACLSVYYDKTLNYYESIEYYPKKSIYFFIESLKQHPELYFNALKKGAKFSLLSYSIVAILSATFKKFSLSVFHYLPKEWNGFFKAFFSKGSLQELLLLFLSSYFLWFFIVVFNDSNNKRMMRKAFQRIVEDEEKNKDLGQEEKD